MSGKTSGDGNKIIKSRVKSIKGFTKEDFFITGSIDILHVSLFLLVWDLWQCL